MLYVSLSTLPSSLGGARVADSIIASHCGCAHLSLSLSLSQIRTANMEMSVQQWRKPKIGEELQMAMLGKDVRAVYCKRLAITLCRTAIDTDAVCSWRPSAT